MFGECKIKAQKLPSFERKLLNCEKNMMKIKDMKIN